jgi:hypothetical protein
MENELIGNIVPDNLSDVKRSSGYNRVVDKDAFVDGQQNFHVVYY